MSKTTIPTGGLADAAVTTAKITDANITTAKIADDAVTSAKSTAGITEVDQWRLTTTFSGNADPIASNWERVDTDGFGKIGTGMSESSGIFTFPSTGLYLVRAFLNAKATNMQYAGLIIKGTTDNFSSVDSNLANNYDSMGSGVDYFACVACEAFFDVTNTSTHKVKFNLNSQNTIAVEGSSDYQRTGVTFIRFGDT